MPRQEDWFREYFDINRNKSNITKVFFFFYFFFDSGGWYAIVCWPFLFSSSLVRQSNPNQTPVIYTISKLYAQQWFRFPNKSVSSFGQMQIRCSFNIHYLLEFPCADLLEMESIPTLCRIVCVCSASAHFAAWIWRWGAESGSWNQVASTNLSIHTPKIDYFAWLLWEHFNKWNSVEWIDIGWINVTTWAEEMRRESDW